MKDLDAIYYAARELPPEKRPAYLDKACPGESALRSRVEQMLAVADEAEAFIPDLPEADPEGDGPGKQLLASIRRQVDQPPDEAIGQMIGRYKIRERVGEGGYGVVYIAEQTEPVRRRVALKVIKLGMDTRAVVARFEAERQALAMMDHPNIAKVLDAGTTQLGRPYFVMELVRGVRITSYCDQANLSTNERLDLFIKVCQAIQHAHQKGVIHRDIKASNILVTLHDGVPVPKVIDFGIAKATEGRLTDATIYTQMNQFIGTPAYMSPEQAEMNGLDIDTRSDIYSLGVLLYELLAGVTPFDAQELMASGLDAMRKTIREKEPLRPSTRLANLQREQLTTTASLRSSDPPKLIHLLKGDLDWIVMKCLEKDRQRRYDTASGLAMDIKRHLNNEVIVARPPSAAYRFQKTFRRHQLAFATAAAVGLALLAGTGFSIWQAVEATRARRSEMKQRIAAQDAQAQALVQQQKAESEKQRAENQLMRAERLVYAGKLMLAQNDFESGNGALVLHHLSQCQETLRGWEYRYLWTRINAKQTLLGHAKAVSSVAFSPDGQRLLTGSEDKTAIVWDLATGEKILVLKGHGGYVLSVAYSPDGQRLVTGGGLWGPGVNPGEIKVWDAATGQLLQELKGHSICVRTVSFSPDSRRIVSGAGDGGSGSGELTVWDAQTGHAVLALTNLKQGVRSAVFSPDGQRIAANDGETGAKVWEVVSGQELLILHVRGIGSVAFSPDGQRIITASRDHLAKVWDAASGRELAVFKGHEMDVRGAAFSGNGHRVVTASSDRTAKVWDARSGQELFTLKGHELGLRSVAFSPDGRRIATAGDDRAVKVWDAEMGQEVPVLKGHTDFVSSISFSADSKRIVTSSGDGTAKVWDTATARAMLTLGVKTNRWNAAGVWSAAFSPDGQRIVIGSQDQTAKVWDTTTGEQLLQLQLTNVVSSVAFSPDGRRIATGAGEWGNGGRKPGTSKLWDAVTGRELLAFSHPHGISGVAFSPDGQRLVAGGNDRTAKVWDTSSGQEILTLQGHSLPIHSVTFSADGQRIVTASQDQTAKVWDAGTGREILTLKGHAGDVRSVVCSPDGTRMVTGSDDGRVKIWDAQTGLELFSLNEHKFAVWSVAFSPDGKRIAAGTAGAGGTARIWSAAPGR